MRNLITRNEELFRRSLLLSSLFMMVIAIAVSKNAVLDPDMGWHLRTGQWILDNRSLPREDPFSVYGHGKPWIAYSWLFEVILHVLYAALGLMGMVVFTTSLVIGIAIALMSLVRRVHADPAVVVGLAAMGILAMAPLLTTPRPWLLSILFFIIELDLLLAAKDSGKPGKLIYIPLLFWIWASWQIQFIYGLFVLGVFLVEPWIIQLSNRKRLTGQAVIPHGKAIWLIGLASVMATLITPNYHLLYSAIYAVILQTGVYQTISEMHAMPFRQAPDWVVLLLVTGAAYALGFRKKADLFLTIIFGVGLFVAFRSRRDIWFIVPPAMVFIASALPSPASPGNTLFTRPQQLAALFIMSLFTFVIIHSQGINPKALDDAIAETYPKSAVYLVRLKHYPGPLYNSYNIGGFLLWQLPELLINIDGRANFHGDERIKQSIKTWGGKHDWADNPELADARLVIGGVDEPLCSLLKQDSRFELVYEDAVYAVFTANKE